MSSTEATQASIKKGWDLYKSIGSPKFIVAPMVNQSELPFRSLSRKYGAELCFTPMFHAKMFSLDTKYREKIFETTPQDRPLFVQFCANDPQTLLTSAKAVADRCDAVDINLGCPQGIAKRGHYGAYLLEETKLLADMVSLLHAELDVPVTCKIRVLPTEKATLDLCLMLQNSGCSILTVHGRTRDMIKQKIGPCDFDIIRKIKETLDIPVVANGGIETLADVKRVLEITGCDGVMVSEGILGNPAIFSGLDPEHAPTPIQMAREYLELVKEVNTHGSKVAARPHLFKILFKELTVLTSVRDFLGQCLDFETICTVPDVIEAEIKKMGEEKYQEIYDKTPTWYMRFQAKKKQKEEEEAKALLENPVPVVEQVEEPEGLCGLFGGECEPEASEYETESDAEEEKTA